MRLLLHRLAPSMFGASLVTIGASSVRFGTIMALLSLVAMLDRPDGVD